MHEDNYLLASGLAPISSRASQALGVVQSSFANVSAPYGEYVRETWDALAINGENSGPAFEILVASVLHVAGIERITRNVMLANCENNLVDILISNANGDPVAALMLTSTLRERFRLADLQAFRYKSFHQGIRCFQLTMDRNEVARKQDYRFDALDELVYAGGLRFDELLETLKSTS